VTFVVGRHCSIGDIAVTLRIGNGGLGAAAHDSRGHSEKSGEERLGRHDGRDGWMDSLVLKDWIGRWATVPFLSATLAYLRRPAFSNRLSILSCSNPPPSRTSCRTIPHYGGGILYAKMELGLNWIGDKV
jgi:hypothetical protein